ncbi:hypothetical protein [Paenibacillus sp. FSL K6-2859]|uniref:hypothetical protein n=1 Tax=Paenibacillus sp. FSL K6-2859 TaxID=2921482 RepID=UPI0030FD1C06
MVRGRLLRKGGVVLTAKQPLGLKPRYIAEAPRMYEIKDAVVRYMDAGLPVPTEWLAEYNELAERRECG